MFRRYACAATVAAAACAGALWCEPVAAQLVTPTSVTVLAGTEFFPSGGLIDNSGLSAVPTAANYLTVTHAAAGAGNAWVTDAPGGGTADYFALDPATAPLPMMVFSLDRQYELTGLVTWGYHFGAGNGNEAKSFQLEFSTNGGASFGAPINVTKPVASQANSSLQAFGSTISANAVRVTFTDNFFGTFGGGDRVGLGEIKFLGEERGFHLQIDRSTGRLSLNNDDPTAKAIAGIDITSVVGGLNPAGWTSIAANYDADNGGSVDPTNTWTEVAATSGNLAEVSLGTANLTPGRTIDLGTAWQQSPFEDVAIKVLLGDGSVSTLPVFYTGNDGEAFAAGDLNYDGAIDAADWPIYRAGYRADLSSLSPAAAYAQGDLNGDGANNVTDFTLFKNAFDAANGAGAFQAMLASAVPEPTTWLLCGVAGALATMRRRRVAGLAACWALALATCCNFSANEVQAAVPELVAHWALDGNANDAAGGFNGTPNAVTFGQPGANANTGSAASFDGSTSTISVPYASALNPASYTVTLWANASSTTGYQSAITSRDDVNGGQSTHGYILYNDPNGRWDYWTGDGDPGWATLAGPTVSVGAWNHFALTFDAATQTKSLFVDGVRVATTTAQGYSPNGTVESEALHIGSGQDDGANFFFAGLIDDVAVFQGVLTSQEIAAVGSQGVAAFTPLRLALQVNTDTGAVSIRNASGVAVELDQYEVLSPSGALNPAQWSSIQDSPAAGFPGGTGAGNGWEELGVANDQFLAEGYLQGASTLANGGALLLGNPFDGSAQDLQFSYRLPSGDVVSGVVEYVSGGIPGDFNGDSRVDGRDLLAWQRGFGAAFDGADLADWADNFGSGASVAASGAIPEPATLALLAGVAAMGLCRRNKAMARNLMCMAALCAVVQAGSAEAAVTLDRNYLFGEGQGENGAAGATVGSNNSLAPGATLDEAGPSGAFLDLFQASGPVYANVATLGRPGAAAGALGIRFDGVDDRLQGTALNIPEEMAQGIPGYPFNYTGILFRGLQFWAYPEAAGINRGIQQGLVMDTIASGGPVITADGKWGQVNSQHSDGLDGIAPVPATVDVVPNAWAHVMHHVYPANGPGAPAIVPQTGAGRNATSVLYVNGVAVSANNDTIDFGVLTAGSRVGVLSVGAEEIGGDGISPAFGNYFQGVMDELQMYVYGDNTASGGQNYGSFDLFADNAWIAGQIASTIPGGTLTDGDVDRDGDVDNGDVDAFIAGWKMEKRLTGAHNVMTVGDWETWSWGDMNHDGVVDLFDWHLLRTNHPEGASLDLGALLAGAAVPEASTAALACLALLGQLRRRRTA